MWAVHLSSTILTLSADAVVVAILAIVLGGLAPLQLCLGVMVAALKISSESA